MEPTQLFDINSHARKQTPRLCCALSKPGRLVHDVEWDPLNRSCLWLMTQLSFPECAVLFSHFLRPLLLHPNHQTESLNTEKKQTSSDQGESSPSEGCMHSRVLSGYSGVFHNLETYTFIYWATPNCVLLWLRVDVCPYITCVQHKTAGTGSSAPSTQ